MKPKIPLIVTGAGGRIGRLLQIFADTPEFAAFSTTWTSRAGQQVWNLTGGGVPDLPKGGILLHLAAVLPGPHHDDLIAGNLRLAEAIIAQDRLSSFSHVVFMSTVAVYAPGPQAIAETILPVPQTDYGRAKLQCETRLCAAFGGRLTLLRLANLAGADALLGGNNGSGDVILDPILGTSSGPVRSYIGPKTLARTLGVLLGQIAQGIALPGILNLAQPKAAAMDQLLSAAGRPWRFGPARPATGAKVEVNVSTLMGIFPLPDLDPAALIAELDDLRGRWP